MTKLEFTQKSLPLFLVDFEKFFETEIVYLSPREQRKVLLVKCKSGVINSYWFRQIANYYSCEIDARGLLILSLREIQKFAKVFGVTIDKQ